MGTMMKKNERERGRGRGEREGEIGRGYFNFLSQSPQSCGYFSHELIILFKRACHFFCFILVIPTIEMAGQDKK